LAFYRCTLALFICIVIILNKLKINIKKMSNTTTVASTKDWGGGVSPFKVNWGKLMMWYFLVSDAFTFSALLVTYGTTRSMNPWWPDPQHVFNSFPFCGHANLPLMFVSLMTFILIMSSVTMVLAVYEGHQGNRKGVVKWMIWTIIGGIGFLSCQAWEWTHLIVDEGTRLQTNIFGPIVNGLHTPGPNQFGQLFFVITGFHGFHVFSGVIINILLTLAVYRGVYDRKNDYEMVEKVGLYWHFVDLVWVFVFLCFYLF
jgi:cytochrome c oxidase subunit III